MPERRPANRAPRKGAPSRGEGRPAGRKPPPRRPQRPLTAAEQRAREVAATRGPRPPRDLDAERQLIAERTVEEWVDEGASDFRDEAAGAAARAARAPVTAARRRRTPPVDPAITNAIMSRASDRRRGERLAARFADAQEAFERERYDEARRIVAPLLREVGGVAAVHELAGLVNYRLGRWGAAVRELETAQTLYPRVELLPVLADGYRALRRWADVERVWTTVRDVSPSQDVLAEARIVAAGAQADRGDLVGALRTMAKVPFDPKRVREHHLRQWYVLGDLHDRAGNPLEATRWFTRIAREQPDFVDVDNRLRALGR